jgi:DNA-directed RNA polymerase specialized sigma24 family protein
MTDRGGEDVTVEDEDRLTSAFEAVRPHLRAVAYRMLGSNAYADDAVQETWLRLDRAGPKGVENLKGWLTTIVARVCLDRLRSGQLQREQPAGATGGGDGGPSRGPRSRTTGASRRRDRISDARGA